AIRSYAQLQLLGVCPQATCRGGLSPGEFFTIQNPQHEIRNSKQAQEPEIQMPQATSAGRIPRFEFGIRFMRGTAAQRGRHYPATVPASEFGFPAATWFGPRRIDSQSPTTMRPVNDWRLRLRGWRRRQV